MTWGQLLDALRAQRADLDTAIACLERIAGVQPGTDVQLLPTGSGPITEAGAAVAAEPAPTLPTPHRPAPPMPPALARQRRQQLAREEGMSGLSPALTGPAEATEPKRRGPAPAIEPKRIFGALALSPNGMSAIDLARAVLGKTEAANEERFSAIRSQLYRMAERGEIRRDGRFYFPEAGAF